MSFERVLAQTSINPVDRKRLVDAFEAELAPIKEMLAKATGTAEPTTKEGKRLAKLEAAGITGDKKSFIVRAWHNAERFGLQVDEETGQIVGGRQAIDQAFAAAQKEGKLGPSPADARIRLKQEFRVAGLIGD